MALSIAALNVNSRGSKSALVLRDNERFAHVFEQPVECPFVPGSYNREESSLRQNIVFRPTPELEEFFSKLDVWAVEYVTEHSERLLGKQLTREQVEFSYVSNIKRAEGKPPLAKFKINMPGPNKPARCWSEDSQPVELIQDWAGRTLKIKFSRVTPVGHGQCSKSRVRLCVPPH